MRIVAVLSLGCMIYGLSLHVRPHCFGPQDSDQPSPAAPKQPLPFSHRKHADASMKCSFCHEMGGNGEHAGIPSSDRCMVCHDGKETDKPGLQTLAGYHRQGASIPWVRVYKVPDYVFFNHKKHMAAGARCIDCHGPVEQRDVLRKEKDISMAACVDCHLARSAPTDCMHCHTSVR